MPTSAKRWNLVLSKVKKTANARRDEGQRSRRERLSLDSGKFDFRGEMACSSLWLQTSNLRWFGSLRGSSSCLSGRPRARWGPGLLKLLRLWWGSTGCLHPAGTPQLKRRKQHEIRGSSRQFNHSEWTYLLQTGLQTHRRAAPAPGRCWWTNPGTQSKFAPPGTSRSVPGFPVGSPGCCSWLRWALNQGIKHRIFNVQM